MASIITGNTQAYTVLKTARYALRSCRGKDTWAQTCRSTTCRDSSGRYHCYFYYLHNGLLSRFYRIGLTKRKSRFRSLMSFSRNTFPRRHALHCNFRHCRQLW